MADNSQNVWIYLIINSIDKKNAGQRKSGVDVFGKSFKRLIKGVDRLLKM